MAFSSSYNYGRGIFSERSGRCFPASFFACCGRTYVRHVDRGLQICRKERTTRESQTETRYRAAALSSGTDVAEMLSVRLSTLRGWMQTEALPQRCEPGTRAGRVRQETREAGRGQLRRELVPAGLRAAPSRTPKVLLDVLKASGSFESEAEDPGAALADVMRSMGRRRMKRYAGRHKT